MCSPARPGGAQLAVDFAPCSREIGLGETAAQLWVDARSTSECAKVCANLLQEADRSMFYVRGYAAHRPLIAEKCGSGGGLWDYLVNGRPVGRPDRPYTYEVVGCSLLNRLLDLRRVRDLLGLFESSLGSELQSEQHLQIQAPHCALKNATRQGVGLIFTVS